MGCNTSQSKHGVPVAEGALVHEHDVAGSDSYGKHWFCDGCKRRSTHNVNADMRCERYRCTQACSFDVCARCRPKLLVKSLEARLSDPAVSDCNNNNNNINVRLPDPVVSNCNVDDVTRPEVSSATVYANTSGNVVGENLEVSSAIVYANTSGNVVGENLEAAPPIEGKYECHVYDLDGKNDYHYVTIEKTPNHNMYKWTNRAGALWSLKWQSATETFEVQPDCCYHDDGHVRMGVELALHGVVAAVYGPGNERYDRADSHAQGMPAIVGKYENHYYDEGGKNGAHWVSIIWTGERNKYTWQNRHGGWALTWNSLTSTFHVGEDCGYHGDGYKVMRVEEIENNTGKQVSTVYGPGEEPFKRESDQDPGAMPPIEGQYKHASYGQVSIKSTGEPNMFKWTGRGGDAWSLKWQLAMRRFDIGKDCTYYSDGYTTMDWDLGPSGLKVAYVVGKKGERYIRC